MSADRLPDSIEAISRWLRTPWQLARDQGCPLCLIRLDMDQSLDPERVRDAMIQCLPRSSSGPRRLSGDDLLIATPATSPETAYRMAYRLFTAVHEGGGRGHMGIGMARLDRSGASESLVRLTDGALHRARANDAAIEGVDVVMD